MNIFCPNLSNKQVKREFDRLKEAVGENRAHYLWNKNNGYSLDRTSDDKHSELYDLCLNMSGKDENKAIQIKSLIYSYNLPDSKESFDKLKKYYNEYISDKNNKQKEDNRRIHVKNLYDKLANKLNLGTSLSTDALNNTELPGLVNFVSILRDSEILDKSDIDLLDVLPSVDCRIQLEPQSDDEMIWFDGKKIHITDSFMRLSNNKTASNLFLNTYLHAVLSKIINNPSNNTENKILSELKSCFEQVNQPAHKKYGINNLQEYLNQFMYNPSFRNDMRSNGTFIRLSNAIKLLIGKDKKGNPIDTKKISDYVNKLICVGYEKVPYMNTTATIPTAYQDFVESLKAKIISGLQKRMKSLKFRNALTYEDLVKMESEINKLQKLESEQAILTFLQDNMGTVPLKTEHYTKEIQDNINSLNDDMSDEQIINFSKQLSNLNSDFIGFYNAMYEDITALLGTYGDEFSKESNTNLFYLSEIAKNSFEHISRVKAIYNNLSSIISKRIILKRYAGITDIDENGNERTVQDVIDAINWVDSEINRNTQYVMSNNQKDVWSINSFAGQYSSSNNSLVRIVANELANGKNRVSRDTYYKGIAILNLYNAAIKSNGIGCERIFQEKDENGNTDGYFTREYKYGLLQQDMKKMILRLGKKYDLQQDKDGKYILPKLGDDNFEKYWDEYDDWMDKYVERKYTKEYYKIERLLGEDAKLAENEIQERINKLLAKTRSGANERPDFMKLTHSEFVKYTQLKNEKAQLSMLYYADGTKKEGKDLEIALQIRKANELKRDKIKYKSDVESFNKAYEEAKKKYKNDPKKLESWLYRNMHQSVPQEFYDNSKLPDPVKKALESDKELQDLLERERAILLPYKNVFKLGYDVDSIPDKLIEELKEIDPKIDNRYSQIFSKFNLNAPKDDEEENRQAGSRLSDDYVAKLSEIKQKSPKEWMYDPWYIRNHYVQFGGYGMKQLRAWNVFAPRDIKNSPNFNWNIIDVDNSEFANKNFKENGEKYQPKHIERYINKDYAKILANKDLLNLYNGLIDLMKESNSLIAYQDNPQPYKLPQMSGRMSSLLRRSHGRVMDMLKFEIDDLVTTHDDDLDYIERQDIRPDGTKIRNVPVRFIKMLKDPSKITSDVVGSVIQFYEMADNYNIMTNDVSPRLEMLAEQAYRKTNVVNSNNKVETRNLGDTNVYRAIRKMLDMHLYGEKRIPIILHILGKDINISKILDKIYEYTSMLHLSFNMTTSTVGYTTAKGAALVESSLGKYFNKRDYSWAELEFSKYVPSIIKGLGSISYNDKLTCCFDFNNTTRQISDIFGRLDQSRVLRFISTHFAYGTYTLGDTAVKGITTLSIYHSYRLCDINGKKMFISREEYINKYGRSDKAAAEKKFNSEGVCLWDAYEVKNNAFSAKEEYKKYITPEFESKIKNRLEAINVRNDGNISELDRSSMFANSILHYVVQHRNFMMLFQERFKQKQYNFKTDTVEEGYYRCMKKLLLGGIVTYKDIFSINRLQNEYQSMDKVEKYGVRKVVTDITTLLLMQIIISTFLLPPANDKDNRDDLLLQELAYVTEKTRFEMGTYYKPDDILGLLRSPSASSSDINNLFSILESIIPVNWVNENPLKPTKTGLYKGMPWIGKKAIKLTPIRNIVESFDAKSIYNKRKYQENQIQNGF